MDEDEDEGEGRERRARTGLERGTARRGSRSVRRPMARDNKLYSGFVRHDYILAFSIEDEEGEPGARLVEASLREAPGRGTRSRPRRGRISNTLSPDEMESTIAGLLGEHDRATYYYLSDSKRMFRVVLG